MVYPFKVVRTPTSNAGGTPAGVAGAIPVSVLGGTPSSGGSPGRTGGSGGTGSSIPGLATWEAQMVTLGNKWCAYRDQQDALGNFEGWGWTADAWYYDGGRVFQQIDDYTANVLQTTESCLLAALCTGDPESVRLLAIGQSAGPCRAIRIFPYGMTMNYWRTHDPVMLNAVNTLATVGQRKR